MIIDQPLLRLNGIHQALFADTVYHPWNASRDLIDSIDSGVSKYVLRAASMLHVCTDVVLVFRPVERPHRAVDIDLLPYRGVSLQLQLSVPEFRLNLKLKFNHVEKEKYAIIRRKQAGNMPLWVSPVLDFD